jgi:hypothetical protein
MASGKTTRAASTAAASTAATGGTTSATATTAAPNKHQRRTFRFRRSGSDIARYAAAPDNRDGRCRRSHQPDQGDRPYVKQTFSHRCAPRPVHLANLVNAPTDNTCRIRNRSQLWSVSHLAIDLCHSKWINSILIVTDVKKLLATRVT